MWRAPSGCGTLDGTRCSTHTPTDEGEVIAMADRDARATAPGEEAKARFKEALDKKRAAQHRTADGETNTGAVHGSETKGPVQKMFRRKSG
jgi:Family of unknown function (DUF5302)